MNDVNNNDNNDNIDIKRRISIMFRDEKIIS
jgi:hypothetical protein